jgi:hypothetical protein
MTTVHDLLTPTGPQAIRGLLAPDVTFHSPVADYAGAQDVAHLLAAIGRCVTDIEVGRQYVDGTHRVTVFSGHVSEHAVDAVLIQQTDVDGRVREATLMLRPLAGLRRAVGLMREALALDPLPSQA